MREMPVRKKVEQIASFRKKIESQTVILFFIG